MSDNIQIDITIKKVCPYCRIEISFHHPNEIGVITLGEHSTLELRIYDTFVNCETCGSPLYLRIQAQPFDKENHQDRAVYRNTPEKRPNSEK